MAALLASLLAGCSDGVPATRGVTGTVVVAGSSTLTPLVRAAADELVAEVEPGVVVDLTTSGTATGLARLCAGAADVAMASREPTGEELAACEAAGVQTVAVPLGLDAVTVVVPRRSDEVRCLHLAELARVFAGAEDQAPRTWADVREGLPATALVPFAPGPASGTADVVVAELLGGEPLRAGVATSEDDEVLVQGVAGSPGGVGLVPLGYALAAEDSLRPLAVDAGDGCVEPSAATAADGSYVPTRPLAVHVSRAAYADDPAVAALVDHLAARAGALSRRVGGVPPDERQQEQARRAVALLGGPGGTTAG